MKTTELNALQEIQDSYIKMQKLDERYDKDLDANKDGKLSADDFKLLRKKKKTDELKETELTPIDIKQKEKVVKGMKKNLQSFKDKYGEKAKSVMYGTATNIAKKMPDVKEEFELEEAKKESLKVYHPGYSAALQHAEKHLNKQGYEIHPEDWDYHISRGPTKPSEGKTVSLHVPLHKDGVPSKKLAHIQVYNRGDDIPNNNELNMYVN